jgi:hypothetical protein
VASTSSITGSFSTVGGTQSFLIDQRSSRHLRRLGETYERNPGLMEHATHLMLVGRSRHASEPEHQCGQFPKAATQSGSYFPVPSSAGARRSRLGTTAASAKR